MVKHFSTETFAGNDNTELLAYKTLVDNVKDVASSQNSHRMHRTEKLKVSRIR
jgi:hypothetical protein